MSIKKINEFPFASGVNLTPDDIFLMMDDPSGSAVTKKVSLSTLSTFLGNGGGSGTSFAITQVDLHNGGIQNAQVLKFDDPGYQSVITGPTPAASGNTAQRLIIQGQRAQGSGEGGDVYLWGGDSDVNGGDIKIYAGDADNVSPDNGYGGYVNIDGGKGATTGGNVEITAGYSEGGQAGHVNIVGGPTSTGVHGNVVIKTNNSTKNWTFNNGGDLEIPGNILLNNGTSVAVGTYDNSTGGNSGVSLNCAVGYELNWQGGRLKSTYNNGQNTAAIFVDSPMSASPVVLASSSNSNTINTNAKDGDMFDVTLTENSTLTNPTNPVNGKTLRWRITQDSTGGRTVALGNKFNLPSSATSPLPWSTVPNKMDILAATYHEGRDKWDIIAFVPGY